MILIEKTVEADRETCFNAWQEHLFIERMKLQFSSDRKNLKAALKAQNISLWKLNKLKSA